MFCIYLAFLCIEWGMIRADQMNQRLCVCLWGLFLAAILLCCGITFPKAEGSGEQDAVRIRTVREGKGTWSVCLSSELSSVTEGRVMILLLTLELPRGGELDRVECGEGAEGLTLTVGTPVTDSGKTRVSVLLDGIPKPMGEGKNPAPILRVFMEYSSENDGEWEGYMGVTPGKYGDFGLYCLSKDGEREIIPLLAEGGQDETADEEKTDKEEVSVEETDERESDVRDEETTVVGDLPQTTTEGEETTWSATESPAETLQNLFMGCRETPVTDGCFAVQLLFYGNGQDTPFVCMEGGGVLRLYIRYGETGEPSWNHAVLTDAEEETKEGRWTVCTLKGLSAEARYVFWIYGRDGIIQLIYDNGVFVGYM